MGIILPNAYALTLEESGDANRPIVGWDNLVTASTVTATEEDAAYPATNLANPSTAELWKSGSTAAQKVTVLFDAADVDYIAIARHNLGSGGCSVTVQGLPPDGSAGTDGDWDELVAEQLLADDSPVIFRFPTDAYKGLRLVLSPDATEPEAAVLYCGKLLVFEKGVQPGFTPITYGRNRTITNLRSQGGDFLGRIVLGGKLATGAEFRNISPDWYRETLAPFLAESDEIPFFWAWRPSDYPAEVGFAWLASPAQTPIADYAGRFTVTLEMEGIIS